MGMSIKKKLKHGSLSVLLTAVFIAAIIAINLIGGLVFERLDITADLTTNRIFSIGDDTREFLSTITDDVTITVTSRENDFAATHDYFNQTNEILKRFAGASSNISLRYIDLMTNPDFAANFDNLDAFCLIVESANTERRKVLRIEDYLELSPMVRAPDFTMAENALASAVLSVTEERPVHVGIITGHGESKNPQIEMLLSKNAYNLHEINLMTTNLMTFEPQLDFIIINSPTADYTADSVAKLNTWLDNDGKFGKTLILTSAVSANTPRLDALLADWGIEVERSYVMQTNPQHAAQIEQANLFIQYYKAHDYDKDFNADYKLYGELMRHVKQLFEARTNITTRPILTSNDGAVVLPFSVLLEGSDFNPESAAKGEFNVGVHSRKTRFEGESFDAYEVSSNLIVFGGGRDTSIGNGDIFHNFYLTMQNSNNAEFFINMMNAIAGKDVILSILPKSFMIPAFEINNSQSQLIAIVFILVLPLAVITLGVIIWIKRIRK